MGSVTNGFLRRFEMREPIADRHSGPSRLFALGKTR